MMVSSIICKLFKLYNPGGRFKDKAGNTIVDMAAKKRMKILSDAIKAERIANGEPERKTHKCGITRSIGFSGD